MEKNNHNKGNNNNKRSGRNNKKHSKSNNPIFTGVVSIVQNKTEICYKENGREERIRFFNNNDKKSNNIIGTDKLNDGDIVVFEKISHKEKKPYATKIKFVTPIDLVETKIEEPIEYSSDNFSEVLEKIKKNTVKTTTSQKKETKSIEKIKSKHSNVKATGVKSVFAVDEDSVLVTSFGRGNSAVVEYTGNFEGDTKQKTNSFNLEKQENKIKVEKSSEDNVVGLQALADNPTKITATKNGETQIGFKSILEKHFFGRTFNDNIHIQIVHNILDIKKILAVHTNNIIYSLDNLTGNTVDDFIGFNGFSIIPKFDDYKKNQNRARKFYSFIDNEKIIYFGNAFFTEVYNKETQKNEIKRRSQKEIYYILSLLNEARIVCTHFTEESEDDKYRSNIFNVGARINDDAKNLLDDIYNKKIEKINSKKFIKNSSSNDLTILLSIFNCKEIEKQEELIKKFYEFSIKKSYKNIGVSVKKIREYMLKISNSILDSDDVQIMQIRRKAYKFYDFAISEYLDNNLDELNKLIGELRIATKEETKEKAYYDIAIKILNDVEYAKVIQKMTSLVYSLSNDETVNYSVKNKNATEYLTQQLKKVGLAKANRINDFSKLIYVITLFLDGKEINDLLTTLVNKFDNIASLLCVLENSKEFEKCSFTDAYAFFEPKTFIKINNGVYECKIVKELKEINSFARMTSKIETPESALVDAAKLLGEDVTETRANYLKTSYKKYLLEKEITKLEKCIETLSNEEQVDEKTLNSKKEELESKNREIKAKYSNYNSAEINFIINNVIDSKRFNYIIRYTCVDEIKKCVKNRNLVEFAFKDIPDTQIDRYYISCYLVSDYNNQDAITKEQRKELQEIALKESRETKMRTLVDMMVNFNYSSNNIKSNITNQEAESKKQIFSLYLNILYQIAKNLVYVNSRYVMAFHSLERDTQMKFPDKKIGDDYCVLSKECVENGNRGKPTKITEDKEKEVRNKAKNGYAEYCENCENKGVTPLSKVDFIDDCWNKYYTKKFSEKERVHNYLEQNLKNADNQLIRQFRNNVAHLNTIRNMDGIENVTGITSYFQIYHYLMQKALYKEFKKCRENAVRKWTPYITEITKPKYVYYNKKERQDVEVELNPKVFGYMENIKNHSNDYCKDFVKALCAPFAYNLPRFKNLSIEELFDMHELSEEPKESMKLTD